MESSQAADALSSAWNYCEAGATTDALREAEQARALFKSVGDAKGEKDALACVLHAHLMTGAAEALWVVNKELSSAQDSKSKTAEAVVLLSVVTAILEKPFFESKVIPAISGGEADGGLWAAEKALELFKSAGDAKGEAEALSAIAGYQMSQGEFAQAAQSYKDAASKKGQVGDMDGQVTMMQAAASAWISAWSPNEACEVASEAIELCKKVKCSSWSLGTAYQALAEVHVNAIGIELGNLMSSEDNPDEDVSQSSKEHYAKALEAATEAAAEFRKTKDTPAELVNALSTIANIQITSENPEEAAAAAKEARKVYKTAGDFAGVESMEVLMQTAKLMQQQN